MNSNGKGEEELDSDDEMERQRGLQKELARRIASGEFTVTKPRYTFLAARLGLCEEILMKMVGGNSGQVWVLACLSFLQPFTL